MIKTACRMALAAAFLCSFGVLWAQQDSSSSSTAPDNTKVNQSDRGDAQTADQQSNSTPDLQMTQQIRKALISDKSLSTYGHNVKIITQQGTVTLRGPVKSEAEKQEIESKAAEVAGSADKVHSELRVAGSSKAKPSANSDQNP